MLSENTLLRHPKSHPSPGPQKRDGRIQIKGEVRVIIRNYCNIHVPSINLLARDLLQRNLHDAASWPCGTNGIGAASAKKPLDINQIMAVDSLYVRDYDPPCESDLPNAISPTAINTQAQSPLFAKLSPEIRHQIFSYVLAEYEDMSRAYSPDQEHHADDFWMYFRPRCKAPLVIDLNLLYTCRRVYYEAHHLPMRLATHRFWARRGRRSGWQQLGGIRFEHLTRKNLGDVSALHMYLPWDWLLSRDIPRKQIFGRWEFLRGPNALPRLRHLTLTVPWTGWTNWLQAAPLWFGLEREGRYWPESLEMLRMELEVSASHKHRLSEIEEIVTEIVGGGLKFGLFDGTVMLPTEGKPWRWSMPLDVGWLYNHEDVLGPEHSDNVEFFVAVVEFRRARSGPASRMRI